MRLILVRPDGFLTVDGEAIDLIDSGPEHVMLQVARVLYPHDVVDLDLAAWARR